MAKIMFVLQRRRDQTREQCLQLWSGERHIGIVRKVPGLTKWVQNHVVSAPGEPACDGIGELWFESDEAMTEALNSAEMAAAVEDAKNFLDMEKTGMVIVREQSVVVPMITAIVQYRLPSSIGLKACAEHFRRIAPGFRTVPGLIRKQFIYAEDGWAGGVYLWKTRADAEAFYSGPWLAGIRERYGMDPQIKYFHTACVTDNLAEAVLLPDTE